MVPARRCRWRVLGGRPGRGSPLKRSGLAADAALIEVPERTDCVKVPAADLHETRPTGGTGFSPSSERADVAGLAIAAGEIGRGSGGLLRDKLSPRSLFPL